MTRRVGKAALALASVVALAVTATAGAGGKSPARPALANLTVAAVADPFSGPLEPGAQVPLAATVKNSGRRVAKASRLGFYLSKDSKFDRGDLQLATAKVKKLKRGKSARVSASAGLPEAARAGVGLIACADSAAKLRERKETDNCARGASALRLLESPGATAPSGESPPSGEAPAPADDPAPTGNVTTALDTAHATRSTIGPAGGTLTATGADGSRFTLEIPADALIAETEISMTPIAGLAGTTFSQGFAGVDLRPHGLTLFEPARLTIEPAQSIPLSNQVGFAYSGTGSEFHYEPLVYDPSIIALDLSHFSGHGAGGATPEDRRQQSRRVIAGAEAQAVQEIAEIIREGRAADLPLAALEDRLIAVYMRWDGGLVGPNTFAAETDEHVLRSATGQWLRWVKSMSLLLNDCCSFDGSDGGPLYRRRYETYESVYRGHINAFKKALHRCNALHEIEAAPLLLSLDRQYDLLFGHRDRDGLGGLGEFESCLRFELDAEIDLNDISADEGVVYGTDHVHLSLSGLKIRADSGLSHWQGSKNATITSWTATTTSEEGANDCGPYSGQTAITAPVEVTDLRIDLNYSDENPTPRPERVVLFLDVGDGNHTYMRDGGTAESPCDWNGAGPYTSRYNYLFRLAHIDEPRFDNIFGSGLSVFRIANFSFVGGGVMARKRYDRTVGSAVGDEDHIVETTELTIRHTPGAP